MAKPTDRHHIWFPRREYTTPLERRFRQLPCNIIRMDAQAHKLLHLNMQPPRKPARDDMLTAIERHDRGLCGCNAAHLRIVR